jgi:hypothetical protein
MRRREGGGRGEKGEGRREKRREEDGGKGYLSFLFNPLALSLLCLKEARILFLCPNLVTFNSVFRSSSVTS